MRPDPGSDLLEHVMGGLDPDARAWIAHGLRERGHLLVWDQVDRAGPMSPVDQAMLILDRMYPEMPEVHRVSICRQIEADYRAGTWHGFERPQPRRLS